LPIHPFTDSPIERSQSVAGERVIRCPECGAVAGVQRNPYLAVDIIIDLPDRGIVLIERRNPPYGWALPGGFVDYGESLEAAALREAREETGLEVANMRQFGAYSDPERDPRGHTVSVVFTGEGRGDPAAADDAKALRIYTVDDLPRNLAFDHARILSDYRAALKGGV
jgi:8-oxo-dGTP diphosphatase